MLPFHSLYLTHLSESVLSAYPSPRGSSRTLRWRAEALFSVFPGPCMYTWDRTSLQLIDEKTEAHAPRWVRGRSRDDSRFTDCSPALRCTGPSTLHALAHIHTETVGEHLTHVSWMESTGEKLHLDNIFKRLPDLMQWNEQEKLYWKMRGYTFRCRLHGELALPVLFHSHSKPLFEN